MNKKINILGCFLDVQTLDEVLTKISSALNRKTQSHLVTPNPEIILISQRDPKFLNILNQAEINIVDGGGLQWAALYNKISLTKIPIIRQVQAFLQLIISLFHFLFSEKYASSVFPQNITGVDLVPQIAKICADSDKKLFLLGGKDGVAVATGQKLQQQYPKLKIVGCSNLDGDFEHEQEIINIINQSQADCLLVAYGAPKQEYWISRNLGKIPTVKLAAGIGGAFDFISQSSSIYGGPPAQRAPLWVRKLKLEWLFRLFSQPNRLPRIFNALISFPLAVMSKKINTKQ